MIDLVFADLILPVLKVGQLEAKVFQEKNAQTLLADSKQVLNRAKRQYQQATTPTDKQAAIAAWHSVLNQ